MNVRSLLRQPLLTVAFHDREARWTLGGRGAIRRPGRVVLPPGLLDDGVITDSAVAGRLLAEAPGFPGNARMQVAAALPAQRSIFRQLDLPPLKGRQFDELAEREIRREMPMLGENAHVAWRRIGERDGKVIVFVIGVARDVLDSHVAALRSAGLHPQSLDLRIIAAARAIGQPDCIVANVEDDEMEIGIFRDGLPAIVRYVAMTSPCGEPAWTDQAIEELARTLKFYRDSHRNDAIVDSLPVTFVGGAAHHVVLGGGVSAATGHEVAMPPLRLTVAPERETVSYAANIGLALKDLAA